MKLEFFPKIGENIINIIIIKDNLFLYLRPCFNIPVNLKHRYKYKAIFIHANSDKEVLERGPRTFFKSIFIWIV